MKATRSADSSQATEATAAIGDCRSCTHFEVGLGGSPYDGYVRCVFDEMGRDPEKAAVDPDRFGRKAMIPDTSRRKNGGFMPDWIRADCADYGSTSECRQYRSITPAKPPRRRNADFGWVRTWLDAAKAFSESTGLELGTPPLDDNGEPYPGPRYWDGCCDELRSYFQSDSYASIFFALIPELKFVGAEERRFAREHIEALQAAVWAFIREMACTGRVTDPLPGIRSAEDVTALFEPTNVVPGTPEHEQLWDEIMSSGIPAYTGPPAWKRTPALMDALATILTLELPAKDEHRPVDRKNVLRGILVLGFRMKIVKPDGKRLSYTEIALLVAALAIDFGPPTTLEKFAQRIRGFESAAIREANKLGEKRRASMPEVDSSASE